MAIALMATIAVNQTAATIKTTPRSRPIRRVIAPLSRSAQPFIIERDRPVDVESHLTAGAPRPDDPREDRKDVRDAALHVHLNRTCAGSVGTVHVESP